MKDVLLRFYNKWTPECIASLIVIAVCLPLYLPGHITFSDLAIGRAADEYLNYVIGIYNEQFGTPNWFNTPRLIWIAIPFTIGWVFGNSGHIFLATLITMILIITVFSFGSLYRRLVKHSNHPLSQIGLVCGALVYALNPWVMVRIQHIFILCGYCLVPLAFSWNWDLIGKGAWNKTDFHVPLNKEEWRKFLLLGFCVSSSFAGIHFGFYIIIVMVFMTLACSVPALIEAFKRRCPFTWFVWYSLRGLLTASTFYVFSIYWVLPFVVSMVQGIPPSQNNVNAIETVVNFSRAVNPYSLLWGVSYWWPMFDLSQLDLAFWIGGGFALAIGLLGVLYSKRFIMFAMTCLIIYVATGTYFPDFAPKYIGYVFNTPYPFGDMIRDPNKLYGIFILPIALFIAYGVAGVEHRFKRTAQQNSRTFSIGLSLAMATSIILWFNPVYQVYINGYYKPVPWPETYDALHTELEALSEDSKVLYLPAADFVTDPEIKVASPDFNKAEIQGELLSKSTGDHMCFDTRMDTLFPFEGNDMMVMQFLRFIHHHLDHGHLDEIGSLVSKAGITHIVMREDYTYDAERLQGYQHLLDSSSDLKKIWEQDFLSLYEVLPAKPDAQYFDHLFYTTGGFERMTWIAHYLDTDIKNTNVLFAYDGHSPEISLLKPGEILEITSPSDLWMTQLEAGHFAYPADSLRNVTPHTGWAKVILSGHDWEHASKHYKLDNHKFNFDMGHGVALTNSPLAIPHRALAPPSDGMPMLQAELQAPSEFLLPFENMSITPLPGDENRPNHIRIQVPGTVKPTEWQMLQSATFPIEELMLYHFTANLQRIDIPGVDVKYRVGYYSKDGNRLGTAFADLETTLPPPEQLEFSNTFLTPKGTTSACVEIRVLNPTGEDVEIELSQLALYQLNNYATPNTLTVSIPEVNPEHKDDEGLLWIRYLCSPKGGLFHLKNDTFDQTLDSKCGPVSRLIWKAYPTPPGFNKEITLTNKTGINAINAIAWLSTSDMTVLQEEVQKVIKDKQLLYIVDSVDLEGPQSVESQDIQSGQIGGTVRYGLNGTIQTTVEIMKEGTYQIDILDYIPFEADSYGVTITNETTSETVHSSTVAQNDERRLMDETRPNNARMIIPNLLLAPGPYTISIQMQSSQSALIEWNDLDNVDVPECIQRDEETNKITRILPMWEKNWGSLNSSTIPYDSDIPLMLWFQYSVDASRSLHGKIRFLDAQGQELSVVYIDDTAAGGKEFTSYPMFASPPPGTKQMMVQFMAQHREVFSEDAKYEVAKFQLWQETAAIGIDAIAVREVVENAALFGSDWEDREMARTLGVEKSRGHRTITLDDSQQTHRIQFFEAPIHHWVFTNQEERLQAFAINGLSFGLQYSGDIQEIKANIPLNRIWNFGIAYLFIGFILIAWLSISIRRESTQTFD